jgi:hypothetical protein
MIDKKITSYDLLPKVPYIDLTKSKTAGTNIKSSTIITEVRMKPTNQGL